MNNHARQFVALLILAVSCQSLASDETKPVGMPDEIQQLCAAFEGLNLDEVSDSKEQLLLGIISNMRGMKCRDTERAKKLFERSALQGNAEAQHSLCTWYGEREDGVNAIAWCKLSSDFGSAEGKKAFQFYKGTMYKNIVEEGLKEAELIRGKIKSNSNKSLKDRDALKRAP